MNCPRAESKLSPAGADCCVETHAVEVREDGIYVGLEEEKSRVATIGDVMVETLVNWGVSAVFGMVGYSNLALADSLRMQARAGRLKFFGVRPTASGFIG